MAVNSTPQRGPRPGPGPGNATPVVCPRCLCCKAGWDFCPECSGVGWFGNSSGAEEDVTGYACRACSGRGGWASCTGDCDAEGRHAGENRGRVDPKITDG